MASMKSCNPETFIKWKLKFNKFLDNSGKGLKQRTNKLFQKINEQKIGNYYFSVMPYLWKIVVIELHTKNFFANLKFRHHKCAIFRKLTTSVQLAYRTRLHFGTNFFGCLLVTMRFWGLKLALEPCDNFHLLWRQCSWLKLFQ